MKAFPVSDMTGLNQQGMDLRDYFAAKAMQGMLAACTGWGVSDEVRLAKTSYEIANAMMKAREL